MSAANEKSSFYVSLGYLGNEGITEGSDLETFDRPFESRLSGKRSG
ncbi:hypothetical protein NIB75_00045 [Bacteroides uniformis]|nr:hypothetical protein [Bacteroides uniformis]